MSLSHRRKRFNEMPKDLVDKIRAALADGLSKGAVCERFNISSQQLRYILGYRRKGMRGKNLAVFVLVFFLTSCTLCTTKAVRDAHEWGEAGHVVRIAQYPVGVDGLLAGLFVWPNHAQAQVWTAGSWWWVCEFGGLCREPTYSIAGQVTWYPVSVYETALERRKHGD